LPNLGKPKLEILPLSIGGKADPVRLIFDANTGPAIGASIMDMGQRFRMVANVVDVVPTDAPLPKLPVARALWLPRPNLKTAAAAWIYAGGAHHTSFSYAVTAEHLQDFASMAGIEFLLIDENTAWRLQRQTALERPVLSPEQGSVRILRADTTAPISLHLWSAVSKI
jgi:L-arabinose isomerase